MLKKIKHQRMLQNYIKVAWRNISRYTFHSVLNIFGLAIGIAFVFLIGGYVWRELQVNKSLKNVSNQYIVQSNWKDPNMGYAITTVGPLAKALKEQYPNLVANYYRWDGVTSTVSKGDKIFREGLQIGDSTLLTMYGFALQHGDAKTALNQPFTTVITEDRAIKYFGKTDVVGETITIESFSGSKHDFQVTGIIKQPPHNSVTRLNAANDNQIYIGGLSIAFFGRTLDNWNDSYRVAYVELKEGVMPADLQQPMQQLLQQNAPAYVAENMNPYLAPLHDYYINQDNGLVKKMLYAVSSIAVFILLMAVINFINLSVSRSSTRIKEIGIRKVMGGLRRQLVVQFLTESVLTVFFATLLSLLIYAVANPALSAVLGKDIPKLFQFPMPFAIIPFLFVLVIGAVAGLYPAVVLSALGAVDSVKGKLKHVEGSIVLRKALVGLQFCTAAIVLIGAIVATRQIALFFSKNLGYDKEFVVSAAVPRDWTEGGVQKMAAVRNQLATVPQVADVSLSWAVPDGGDAGSTALYAEGADSTQAIVHQTVHADNHYLDVFKIPLRAGRFFQQPSDSLNLVLNETAVKAFGYKTAEDALGKRMYLPGKFAVTIIGVVADFHFSTMKDEIKPLLFLNVELSNTFRIFCIKLKPGNTVAAIGAVQKAWSALLPGAAFEYRFMNDSLQAVYQSELQLQKAAQVATALALVMVVLGIIGLVSLSIQKRVKEIGIRKVLGASVPNITALFLADFLPVILIGSIIAVPIAAFVMQRWLADYTYRVPLDAIPFLIAIGALAILTSLLIVLQTMKAATTNPVKNLRTE